jgi:hypothetical protein
MEEKMKKLIFIVACIGFTGCARVMETKEMEQSDSETDSLVYIQPAPNVTVSVNNGSNSSSQGGSGGSSSSNSTSDGGSSNSSGNSTTATGGGASSGNSTSNANNSGSSNNTNSGSASNNANVSSSNSNVSSNTNMNTTSVVTNVSQVTDVDVDNDLQLTAALLAGRAYEAGYCNRAGAYKCARGEKMKKNRGGVSYCVKKPKSQSNGLKCSLYDLSATKPNALPNFSSMTPVYNFVVDQLDVGDQDWQGGFPKINDNSIRTKYLEWYGVRCKGKLKITKADTYGFYLSADDGAILTINNSSLVNNDGLHPVQTKSGSLYLAKGNHPMQVDYFQGPRVRIALLLEWSSSTFTKTVLTKNNLLQ